MMDTLTDTFDPQAATRRVREFAARVFRRSDGPDEVVPPGFEPDWDDMPARFRTYRARPRIALPGPMRLQQHFENRRARCAALPPTLQDVALMLHLGLAPLRRKLDITWNAPRPAIGFAKQDFGRGTASGGGLYPTQAYLVSAGGAPGAGVYHYDAAQHALVPIRPGHWDRWLAEAIGGAAGEHVHPYYLVLSPDFWMNGAKYHNFGLHVCSQDVGALLATLQLVGDAIGVAQRAFTVFDDAAVDRLTGADGVQEGAFAVVALGPAGRRPAARPARFGAVPAPWQKSRRVRPAPEWQEMHRLMRLDAAGVERTLARVPAAVQAPPDATDLGPRLPAVLRSRRSAWGSLHGPAPIDRTTLVGWLGFVRGDTADGPIREALPASALQWIVRAQHVSGLEAGTFRCERADFAALPSAPSTRWQDTYAMHNYNLDEAGALVFVCVDVDAVLERYGARGYRILNAHVGRLVQRGYVGAAAQHLDVGAVLGVRAQHVKRTLGLQGGFEVAIALYLSRSQPAIHLFDHSLLPDGPAWEEAA